MRNPFKRQAPIEVHIHTDGGCIDNGTPKAKAAWAWYCKENGESNSGRVEGKQSNNTGELTAIIKSLEWAQRKGYRRVTVYSDSQYAIKCIVGVWNRKLNRPLFDQIDGIAVQFEKVHFQWVRGHSGDEANDIADELCRKALGLAPKSALRGHDDQRAKIPQYSYKI